MMRVRKVRNSWLALFLAVPITLCSQNVPELLGEAINTDYNEIGPVIAPDGKTLFFSRISHPQNAHGEKGSQDIWYSELRNNRWTNAVRMPNAVNKEVYNAIYSITPDGNTILLKGSYQKGVYQTRGFSISKRVRRSWTAPETINIPDYEKMSKGEFDCAFLTNDGNTLLISFSEKKKGRNDDLYVSFKDKEGKWSKPQSLGSDINTPMHMETTPFLAADGVTLYFSSDRPGGKGGNDIYMSRRLDGTWKKWTKPVNLGSPVNTPGFEGYYTVSASGDYAYWSSNNEGVTKKGDIYRLSLKKPDEKDSTVAEPKPTETIARAERPSLRPDPVAMISGKVLDSKSGKPIEATIVFRSFPDGKEIGTASTNPETGEYKFTLPYGSKYTMGPVAKDFIAENELIDLTDAAMARSKRKDLLLTSTQQVVSADSVSGAKGDGKELASFDPEDKSSASGVVAQTGKTGDSTDVIVQTGKTEADKKDTGDPGKSSEKQSAPGDSGVSSSGEKDIELVKQSAPIAEESVRDSTHTRTYQEIDKDLRAVPIEVGGVVRLNNIFFETASSRLRAESKVELDELVKLLNEHTSMRVELGGHTDSEGSESSNLRLSQARSNAVRTYLLSKGIPANRVESVGYGESRPVATNDTPEGRQANRRVEFTILNK